MKSKRITALGSTEQKSTVQKEAIYMCDKIQLSKRNPKQDVDVYMEEPGALAPLLVVVQVVPKKQACQVFFWVDENVVSVVLKERGSSESQKWQRGECVTGAAGAGSGGTTVISNRSESRRSGGRTE